MLNGPIPALYRSITILLLLALVALHSWLLGARHVQREFDTYTAQVRAFGEQQTARTKVIQQTQTNITAKTEASYASGTADIHRLYGPGRVHHSNARPRAVPRVPAPTPVADAAPADGGLGAAGAAPKVDLTCGLADAAETTRQLLYLQEWVREQERAMGQQ